MEFTRSVFASAALELADGLWRAWRPDKTGRWHTVASQSLETTLAAAAFRPRDLALATMPLAHQAPLGVSSKYLDPAVAMLDCGVQRLHKDMTPQTLRALLTARGGEELRQDETRGWSVLEDGRLREVAPRENDQ